MGAAICLSSRCSSNKSRNSPMAPVRMTSIWTISPIWSQKRCSRSIWARQHPNNKQTSHQLAWTTMATVTMKGIKPRQTLLPSRASPSQVRCPISTSSRWLACLMTPRSTWHTNSRCSSSFITLACRLTHLVPNIKAISHRRAISYLITCPSTRRLTNPPRCPYLRCTILGTCHYKCWTIAPIANSRYPRATSFKCPFLRISSWHRPHRKNNNSKIAIPIIMLCSSSRWCAGESDCFWFTI